MIGITVLGATGSIGLNTLDVIRLHKDKFQVVALSANTQVKKMLPLIDEFQPHYVAMADEIAAQELEVQNTSQSCHILSGEIGLKAIVALEHIDYVVAGIVGAAGLQSTLAAVQAGKRVLLANKEPLVMAGQIFIDAVKQYNAQLLPVDSEHNAIFQCLPNIPENAKIPDIATQGVDSVTLTASGGPFRDWPIADIADATPAQACAHPNWDMGQKISVDSATMMNKGFEIIEACWLFDIGYEKVDVVLHPQSIIHSMVYYTDGSVLAQLGQPDMRTPIAHALGWPKRIASGVKKLDLTQVGKLEFRSPEIERYPCLLLAVEAMKRGGTATAILNAANEEAVEAFLQQKISFSQISVVIDRALQEITVTTADTLDNIMSADKQARRFARTLIEDGVG